MPWSNQTGNGGWKGGGGGPWGQGSQPPRPGSSSSSPDLEDILRRGQDRLRRAIPGGTPGANGRWAIGGLVALALVVFWLLNAVHMVQPGEYGVKVFLGKPREELASQGLNFTLWPLETFETVPSVENQLAVGRTGGANTGTGLMLSGDQNIVDVQFAVLYRIDNPQAYLFNVDDPEGMLRQVAESAMREVVGRSPVDDLFRDDRAAIANSVRDIMQGVLDSYGSGVRVNAVSIEETAPPAQVANAFDEVQRATQDQDRFVDEANLYRNQQLGKARGDAVQAREDGAAYKVRVSEEAAGEAQRFSSILDEYQKAPDITRKRIFLETMQSVYAQSNNVLIEPGADGRGIVPYLPLGDLQRQGQAANPAEPNPARPPLGTASPTIGGEGVSR